MYFNNHIKNKKFATVTTVKIQVPQERFGVVYFKNKNIVREFVEKPDIKEIFINGGFFVLSKKAIKYIDNFLEPFETGALPRLAAKKELSAFKHEGFWYCMDTQRDKYFLENLTNQGTVPWLET